MYLKILKCFVEGIEIFSIFDGICLVLSKKLFSADYNNQIAVFNPIYQSRNSREMTGDSQLEQAIL